MPTLQAPHGLRWFTSVTEPGCHELRDVDDHVAGTLRFQPKPVLTWGFTDRRHARGDVGSLHWDLSIERKGISGAIGASATARVEGSSHAMLEAGAFFATGTLTLDSGRQLRWEGSVLEGTPCRFVDGRRWVVQINPGSFSTRMNGSVDVQPDATDTSEWALLVVLALYLRLLMNRVWD